MLLWTPIEKVELLREPSATELEVVAYEVAYETMSEKLRILSAQKSASIEGHAEWLSAQTAMLQEYTRKHLCGELDDWSNIAVRSLKKRYWCVEPSSQAYTRFIDLIAKFSIEALRVAVARSQGKLGEIPQGTEIERASQNKTRVAPTGEKLPQLYDLYEAHLTREKAGGLVSMNERRRVLDLFSEFIGVERSLKSVITADVREFVNALADAPKGYAKMAAFKGLNLKAAISKGAEMGLARRSTVTINKELSFLSTFFKWCRQCGYCDINPCEGFAYKVHWTVKDQNRRPPFDDDEINRIFQSALFRRNGGDGFEHIEGNIISNDWRKWVPLICLFTGARTSEAAQLYTDDIFEIQGVWVLRFKANTLRKTRIKNRGSERLIPVHSMLEKVGFLDFARAQSLKINLIPAQLFDNLKPDNRGVMGAAPSKFFGKYLTQIGVKTGADGRGMHSFRHSMSDALRLAGFYDLEFGSAILGHSNKSMTAKYGQIPQGTLAKRKAMIEAIAFDGIDLTHLVSA